MTYFRLVFDNGNCTNWISVKDWEIADMQQFQDFGNYQIEWK